MQADERIGRRLEAADELRGERLGLAPHVRTGARQQAGRFGEPRRLVTREARDVGRRRERVEGRQRGAEQRRTRRRLGLGEVGDPAAVDRVEDERLSAPGARQRRREREVPVVGLELARQEGMDTARLFGDTVLVDLDVRHRAPGGLEQREHQRLLRLVAEDAGACARAAEVPGQGRRVAEDRREGHELPVVRKRPEQGPEVRRMDDPAKPATRRARDGSRPAEGLLGLPVREGAAGDPRPPAPRPEPEEHT